MLIGHGNIGRHHLRILRSLQGAQVIGIIDPVCAPIEGLQVWKDWKSFTASGEHADCAVVAAPIAMHYDLGCKVLNAGMHLFMEKPVAATAREAHGLRELAHAQARVLLVGHSERYNPAFPVFLEQFRSDITGQVYRMECERTGPYPQRIGDSGATIDLAVHDLDSLNIVMDNQRPEWVFARSEQRIHPTREDGINAMMGYAGGVLAQMTVNWLSPRKNRLLKVYGRKGMLQCDFYLQKVTFFANLYQRSRPDEYGIGGIEVGPETEFEVSGREPLQLEHEAFLRQVQLGEGDPLAVQSACLAVETAERLLQSASQPLPGVS